MSIWEEVMYDSFEDLDDENGRIYFAEEDAIMGNIAEGFITKIVVRDGNGKRGPWALDNLVIADANGNELGMFGLGFRDDPKTPPKCVEGNYVRFEWEQSGDYRNIIKGTAKIVADAPKQAAPTTGAPSAATTGPARSTSGSSTQQNIHYQNSRTAAIQALEVLLSNDAVPLNSTKTKAGQAKAYEAVMAMIDKITVRFFYDLETFRLLDTVADEGDIDTGADAPLPDSEDVASTSGDEDEPV